MPPLIIPPLCQTLVFVELPREYTGISTFAALPQKVRQLCQQQQSKIHAKVTKLLKVLKPVQLPSAIDNAMPDHVMILNKIENNPNYKPTETELKKLDQLYDALKKAREIDTMPVRSKDWAEYFQVTQKIQQNYATNKGKIRQLMQKCQNKQHITIPEAIYLKTYLNKSGDVIPSMITNNLHKCLAGAPADLKTALNQMKELLDPKALKVINDVIKQIEHEHGLRQDGINVPELGIALKPTSQFMEVRFANLNGLRKELRKVKKKEDLQKMIGTPNTDFWKNLKFRYHRGLDFTVHAKNDGTVTYQYGLGNIKGKGTGIKPKIVEVLSVVKDTSTPKHDKRNAKVVTILEYHPAYGVLLTTFRHLPKAFVQVGNNLTIGQAIGTYEIPDEHLTAKEKIAKKENEKIIFKEHVHLERKYADIDVLDSAQIDKLEAELNKSTKDPKAINEIKAELAKQAKFTQPIVQNNDYHTIALFIPGSALNLQFLKEVEQKWRPYHNQLVKDGRFNVEGKTVKEKVSLIISYLEAGAIRDQFTLETFATILLKLKSLWATVGEHNNSLESTLQYAQRVATNLRKNKIPKKFKILH